MFSHKSKAFRWFQDAPTVREYSPCSKASGMEIAQFEAGRLCGPSIEDIHDDN